ncbi:MAG: lactate dehydrogenase [Clostridium sp.]
MYYYLFKNNLILSKTSIDKLDYEIITEVQAKNYSGKIYILHPMKPEVSRRSFIISNKSMCFLENETLMLLSSLNPEANGNDQIPIWLEEKIKEGVVISVNPNYPNYEDVFTYSPPEKWNVNVIGLGDVGATLLTGLKLLGTDFINNLGIYDLDKNKVTRLKFELSQILSANGNENSLKIKILEESELFNCDMFVFCVSVGVPPIGKEEKDVRLVQFEGNRKVLKHYGKLARNANFKGVFAVVSDPVDLLCKSLFEDSNRDDNGNMDYTGLAPEQIRGYGLGVMNARAVYYSSLNCETENYISEGRAYGPHGEGLIIANSIQNFNEDLTEFLTQKTKNANLEVRSSGFKPYIAPALSSGTLSLLDTIAGNYHYSSNFLGGTFMGCKNRYIHSCTENELVPIPDLLMKKLKETYTLLSKHPNL